MIRMNQIACYAALIAFCASCKTEAIITVESAKEIAGNWRVTQASRNGTDITEKFDFSGFSITFNEDGTYRLQQPLPFIVSESGSFALDDPQYPFQISFTAANSDGAVSSSFEYPIVAGRRNLLLTFSPGCGSNTYRYTLIRD